MPNFQLDNVPENTLTQTLVNTNRSRFEDIIYIERSTHLPNRLFGTEPLDYQQLASKKKYFVLIQLPKKGRGKINLELNNNRLVVVIPVENPVTMTVQKHYAEVYLPASVKLNRAVAELGQSLLIVTFNKQKPNLLEQALSRFVRGENIEADSLGYM